jgi:hypothetical protein
VDTHLNINTRFLNLGYVLQYNNKGAKLLAQEDGYDLKVIISTQNDFNFHAHQENIMAFIAA